MRRAFLAELWVFKRGGQRSRRAAQYDDLGLKSIWLKIRTDYFPDRTDLDVYSVRWSRRRQRRVLASVSISRMVVTVAKELDSEAQHCWLEPLLYHEMCHAALGHDVPTRGIRKQWHGREFKMLERIHPDSAALNEWIRKGGWTKAVRSSRTKESWQRRRG